ncbi:MAG: hypothetical protein ACRCW2_05235 [Cellulosilyticaceae bacterium]
MANAALKRHYRVVQRDKQECSEEALLEVFKIKEVAVVAGMMYLIATLMSFVVGYTLGKRH